MDTMTYGIDWRRKKTGVMCYTLYGAICGTVRYMRIEQQYINPKNHFPCQQQTTTTTTTQSSFVLANKVVWVDSTTTNKPPPPQQTAIGVERAGTVLRVLATVVPSQRKNVIVET